MTDMVPLVPFPFYKKTSKLKHTLFTPFFSSSLRFTLHAGSGHTHTLAGSQNALKRAPGVCRWSKLLLVTLWTPRAVLCGFHAEEPYFFEGLNKTDAARMMAWSQQSPRTLANSSGSEEVDSWQLPFWSSFFFAKRLEISYTLKGNRIFFFVFKYFFCLFRAF